MGWIRSPYPIVLPHALHYEPLSTPPSPTICLVGVDRKPLNILVSPFPQLQFRVGNLEAINARFVVAEHWVRSLVNIRIWLARLFQMPAVVAVQLASGQSHEQKADI